MAKSLLHEKHNHTHGGDCGHAAIKHGNHVDYLHDGHLHHQDGQKCEEHTLDVNADNPSKCTPNHSCEGHKVGHVHTANCGHPRVPHGDHVDFLVGGHLHHPHENHCDHHGEIRGPV